MDIPENLRTQRLSLTRPHPSDAADVFAAYAADPEVTRYLTWEPHSDEASVRAFLRETGEQRLRGEAYTWLVRDRSDGSCLGMISARDGLHGMELGYVLARAAWGRGLMTEAAGAVVAMLLAQPDVWRVWAYCDCENAASARVMLKLGMTREGTLKRWSRAPALGDAPRDCDIYARTR